jgi:hypothetical protein
VLWTWVMGGTPLALALIRRTVEWSLDAICAGTNARGSAAVGQAFQPDTSPGTIALGSAAEERPASDSALWRTHG